MFQNWKDEIVKLNNGVKTVASCERARALRKKLLKIGVSLAVIGFTGVFVCFILFATAGASGFTSNGFSARILIPFFLFLPCGVVGSIGTTIASLGLKIMVTDYASTLIDETIGNACPHCNDPVEDDEIFCSNCGKKLKTKCPSCQTVNSVDAKFCKRCGFHFTE